MTEYPRPVAAFSERIGTALINGAWFLRELKPYAARIAVMHGHRHVDWMGKCGALTIVSAPSPVMGPESRDTHFYVQALTVGADGADQPASSRSGSRSRPSRAVQPAPAVA